MVISWPDVLTLSMFTKGGFHSINWQCISTLRKKSGKSEFFIAWENGEISANSVCVRSLDFSRSGDNFFLNYHIILFQVKIRTTFTPVCWALSGVFLEDLGGVGWIAPPPPPSPPTPTYTHTPSTQKNVFWGNRKGNVFIKTQQLCWSLWWIKCQKCGHYQNRF